MTALARVITVGRNSDMPKVVRIPVGVGVDGCAITAPVTIRGDECLCPACKGWSRDEWHNICADCDGRGIVTMETECTAGPELVLTPAVPGRDTACCVSGSRPTHPGVQPVSLATGAQSYHHEGVRHPEHTAPLASHRPAAPPVYPRQGTLEAVLDAFTVVTGLFVFGMIAFFLLLL
jgi:hypothetical protein